VDRHRIEVWYVDLEAPSLDECAALLTSDELAVAARGRPPVRRERIVSRAALRVVLAPHLRCRPSRVRLVRTAAGKPQLDARRPSLQFSLSHTPTRCAIAVSRGQPVGVDVEDIAVDLPEAVVQAWTRAEARLKARGTGLTTRASIGRTDPTVRVVDLRPGQGHVGAVAIWSGERSAAADVVDVVERVLPVSELSR
jgi:phosphopantetheinyl transferase